MHRHILAISRASQPVRSGLPFLSIFALSAGALHVADSDAVKKKSDDTGPKENAAPYVLATLLVFFFSLPSLPP